MAPPDAPSTLQMTSLPPFHRRIYFWTFCVQTPASAAAHTAYTWSADGSCEVGWGDPGNWTRLQLPSSFSTPWSGSKSLTWTVCLGSLPTRELAGVRGAAMAGSGVGSEGKGANGTDTGSIGAGWGCGVGLGASGSRPRQVWRGGKRSFCLGWGRGVAVVRRGLGRGMSHGAHSTVLLLD